MNTVVLSDFTLQLANHIMYTHVVGLYIRPSTHTFNIHMGESCMSRALYNTFLVELVMYVRTSIREVSLYKMCLYLEPSLQVSLILRGVLVIILHQRYMYPESNYIINHCKCPCRITIKCRIGKKKIAYHNNTYTHVLNVAINAETL